MPEFPEEFVNKITIRAITSSGNLEWSDAIIIGPGWSYDSFDFNRAKWT